MMFDFNGCMEVFGAFSLILVVGAIVGATDAVQATRARHDVYACEAANQQAVRKFLSSEVVCRSRNLSADTLNVRNLP